MDALLDLALLQTLIAVQRGGSLSKAAQLVGRTQSAVSLQIQRLEEMLAAPLFDRSGRSLILTDAGETMLQFAHRMLELNGAAIASVRGHQVAGHVSLGMSMDFEHAWLPKAMMAFTSSHPKIQVAIRVGRNAMLEAAVANGEVDIALIFAAPAAGDAAAGAPAASAPALLGSVPMAWVGRPDFVPPPAAPLPLLLLDGPCLFRSAALAALEQARMPWHAAVSSPSLGGLWGTALAGMGVVTRSSILLPPGLADVGARLGLPPLPDVGLKLLQSDAAPTPQRATLHRVLHALASEVIQRR